MRLRTVVDRAHTAIGRVNLSRPIRLALDSGLIAPGSEVLDYGCGRGDDVRLLRSLGMRANGWDPVHCPHTDRKQADIVNLGYVINVIEDPVERARTLTAAWELAQRLFVVSARLDFEASAHRNRLGDGWLTSRNTFQKFFAQNELRDWIDRTLDVEAVAAGPGVFYVFRDPRERESFLEARQRRGRSAPQLRKSDVLFETHRRLLEPLIDFVTRAGRLPAESELSGIAEIAGVFGSLKRAFAVVRRVTGGDQWDAIREQRRGEILRYLALARFGRRPHYGALPAGLQLDVRELFGTYRGACDLADSLLFSAGDTATLNQAVRQSPVGKLTPAALYVHVSALQELPLLLQVYEGCARAYVGVVDGANIIKLHRHEPAVSYLAYPDFDRDPHPALIGAMRIGLRKVGVRYRDYVRSPSPPVLHRKEAFISPENPLRPKFERLTAQEERMGLLRDPHRIGTRRTWESRLAANGVALRGHRVVRVRQPHAVQGGSW